jgi:ABC-2 type transport system permease protein
MSTNTSTWLIRREFWENRAIWVIPAVFGAMLILAALFGQVSIPKLTTQAEMHEAAGAFQVVVGAMFYVVMSVYATWYLLDCLYADRRDRSILFWKSLPISDAKTVLIKLLVGMILIPLVYFAAADATALMGAFILSIRARASLGSALWQPEAWWDIQVLWMYCIITTAIWYLPIAGWLMLVSAWAKRAVMLWSVLPPLVAYIFERVFFGTHVIGHTLTRRLMGLPMVAFNNAKHVWTQGSEGVDNGSLAIRAWDLINPSGFFTSVETWIGAAVGIVLIVGAIQLRMRRSEI